MAGVTDVSATSAPPVFKRVRHEVRVRRLEVIDIGHVTPAMLRVTLAGDDLIDFDSCGFDDHVKLLLPQSDGSVERRDYTPRRFDRAARTLAIDFALHDAGPATGWARRARPGDRLDVAGPKGSRIAPPSVRRWLLIGDETALPAIGRMIEEADAGTRITCLAAVTAVQGEQTFTSAASVEMRWVHRPSNAAADPEPLSVPLDALAIPPETFAWIAAEGTVARALRERLVACGHSPAWIKAAGYWIAGHADAHLKLD